MLVPPAGLEPARPCGQQILSLPRLPIPPRGPAPAPGILGARPARSSAASGRRRAGDQIRRRCRPPVRAGSAGDVSVDRRHPLNGALDRGDLKWPVALWRCHRYAAIQGRAVTMVEPKGAVARFGLVRRAVCRRWAGFRDARSDADSLWPRLPAVRPTVRRSRTTILTATPLGQGARIDPKPPAMRATERRRGLLGRAEPRDHHPR
jgi:hypothetical protein